MNSSTASSQNHPSVAMDSTGNFVIAWTIADPGGSHWDVNAKRFNKSGSAVGTQFQVNTASQSVQCDPSVAMDATGDFVIAWKSGADVVTGAESSVQAQRFNSAGIAQGANMKVSNHMFDTYHDVAVTMDSTGNFVITTSLENLQDGMVNPIYSTFDVYAYEYDASGVAEDSFRVNSTTTSDQQFPSVAMNAGGTFVVAWTSAGQDGSGRGVYAQRYQPMGSVEQCDATLNITGTPQNDVISVSEGTSLTVTLNGTNFVYPSDMVFAISIEGLGGNDTITINSLALGTTLRADGGSGNDVLTVASSVVASVVLVGGEGNDTLRSGGGSDILIGGTGNDTYVFTNSVAPQTDTLVELASGGTDTLDFSAITTAVTANLLSDAGLATMANRTVRTGAAGQAANFENVIGGSGNDSLTGNAASNVLSGNGGNDILTGGAGNDTYVFANTLTAETDTVIELAGGGTDTLSFNTLTTAVTANLLSDSALATMANRTIRTGATGQAANFENVIGGSGNDTLTGNAASNILSGNGGNDRLTGGVGNDTYIFASALAAEVDTVVELAGGGVDTLDFSALTTSVMANLTSDSALATMANRTVKTGAVGQAANLENVSGGSAGDTLVGNAVTNTLTGNAGNDILIGGGGSDNLVGNAGDDLLIGGTTSFDHNSTALTGIHNEWIQPTSYLTRVGHLRGTLSGGVNGANLLTSTTVQNDGVTDTLTGGAGNDWFWIAGTDVTDMVTGEVKN